MDEQNFQGTINLARENVHVMNAVNWSTAFLKLSKLRQNKVAKKAQGFTEIVKEFEGKVKGGGLKWCGVGELASVARSFRYLGVESYELRDFVEENATEITEKGNSSSLADLALIYKDTKHGYAEGGDVGGSYFSAMEEQRVVEYMLSKRTMDVAKYISAAAGTGRKVPVLAREIDKEKAVKKFAKAHPQDLSTSIFGLARLGHPVPHLLERIGQEDVVDRIVDAYPGDIANTMWSFAAYGHKASRLVDAIVERPEVMQKIAGGREVDVSRTVFALQKLEGKVPMLLKEALRDKKAKRKKKKLMTEGSTDLPFKQGGTPVVVEQNLKLRELQKSKDWSGMLRYAAKRSSSFDHVNWTTLFSELGKFRFQGQEIAKDETFRKLLGEFEEALGEKDGLAWMDVRGIANIMFGLGLLRVESKVVLNFVEKNAAIIIDKASAEEIANIANCYAVLKFEGGTEFFNEIKAENVVEKIMAGKVRNRTFIIWAAATLGHQLPLLAEALETEASVNDLVGGDSSRVPINFSNQLWALAALGCEAPRLREAALKEVKDGSFSGAATNVKRRLAYAIERLGGGDVFEELNLDRGVDAAVAKGSREEGEKEEKKEDANGREEGKE
ncbi:hypothetical protein TrST_g10572 [Triparma strigata]|uniref:Uncharacterized protein n=1 Tax=Triparma strigata TaxID=1606541 RepID=A0A9W7ATH0_9STRA|nr:hypothetical protein TrST_g10572 [Triparma strigata]